MKSKSSHHGEHGVLGVRIKDFLKIKSIFNSFFSENSVFSVTSVVKSWGVFNV